MNKIDLLHQEGALKSYFPNSKIIRNGNNEIIWSSEIRPSALSSLYTLKLHYEYKKQIRIFVISPTKLALAEGKTELPHVYSTVKQQLCLYYPKDKEWDLGMYYVHTLIPWASEWLIHYELWVSTGTWHGGGIPHEIESEKQETIN
ncbi:hypothetical protein [Parasediminibacterium sp. JCM 36343]|uniref:hypothetical protein n=1 Tax=Parasediminibacterium sp. JCM 36343 TaxID=3374279 RepID=UPI003978CD4E